MFIRYAVIPADQARIKQLDGISRTPATKIPEEGDRIDNPCLVDPVSLEPVTVIVMDVIHGMAPGEFVVVVTRPQ